MLNPPDASDSAKLTFSVKAAAALLNNTYALVNTGRLKSVRVGRRLIIPKRELDDFLNRETSGEKFPAPA